MDADDLTPTARLVRGFFAGQQSERLEFLVSLLPGIRNVSGSSERV
jgi:hypothetical protein